MYIEVNEWSNMYNKKTEDLKYKVNKGREYSTLVMKRNNIMGYPIEL